MARGTLGPLLNTLSGKLGNQVITNSNGLFSVRSMPKADGNPQSAYQAKSRRALAVFVEAWRALSLAERSLWVQVAAQLKRGQQSDASTTRGDLITVPRGPFTAYNAFITANMNRYMYDYSLLTEILEAAPIGKPLLEPLLTFTAAEVVGDIEADWTYITPGAINARLGIWIKSVDGRIHPQLIYTEARNADGGTAIVSVRGANGNPISPPSGVYQLQAIIVNEYGFTTAPSELVSVLKT